MTVIAPGLVATGLLDGIDGEAAERLRGLLADQALAPSAVAAQVAHVLALPRDILVREITLSATAQES